MYITTPSESIRVTKALVDYFQLEGESFNSFHDFYKEPTLYDLAMWVAQKSAVDSIHYQKHDSMPKWIEKIYYEVNNKVLVLIRDSVEKDCKVEINE